MEQTTQQVSQKPSLPIKTKIIFTLNLLIGLLLLAGFVYQPSGIRSYEFYRLSLFLYGFFSSLVCSYLIPIITPIAHFFATRHCQSAIHFLFLPQESCHWWVGVILGIFFIILAIFTYRGKKWARISSIILLLILVISVISAFLSPFFFYMH